MAPISESRLEGVLPKDVSSALRIQSGSACFLSDLREITRYFFFIKTWQGAIMMRIISDEKGGHWGWCSGPLLQILCYAVLMM